MNLNLPIFDQVAHCQNLLIAGMGGGFDLFCGLPIYFELQKRGQKAHLASFSFSDIVQFKAGIRLTSTLEALQSFLAVRKDLKKRVDSRVPLP